MEWEGGGTWGESEGSSQTIALGAGGGKKGNLAKGVVVESGAHVPTWGHPPGTPERWGDSEGSGRSPREGTGVRGTLFMKVVGPSFGCGLRKIKHICNY